MPKQGRRQQVDERIMARLKVAYQERCGSSPTRLIQNLLEYCYDRDGSPVLCVKTVRTFFKDGAAAPATVDIMCRHLLQNSYGACLDAVATVDRIKTITPPIYWVGRSIELQRYQTWLQNPKVRGLLLLGEGGIGKTTLAEGLALHLTERFPLQVLIRLEAQKTPDQFLTELAEALGYQRVSPKNILNHFKQSPTLVIVDNLDSVLTNLTFAGEHQSYRALFESWIEQEHQSLIIFTSRSKPWLQPRDRTALKEDRLQGLARADWLPFFIQRYRDYDLTNLLVSPEQQAAVQAVGQQCAGHPLALHLLCLEAINQAQGHLAHYLAHSPGAYTWVSRVVAEQFEQLRHEDLEAWKLLIRLGVYRFSLGVTRSGLEALLWEDRPERKSHRVNALLHRHLLEFDPLGNGYRLHPLIAWQSQRELSDKDWWTECHRQAAQYWEKAAQTCPEPNLRTRQWDEAGWHWGNLQA